MEYHYLKMLEELIVELSWPIVTLIVLFNFKTQIRFFLQNIKLFKALGGEIETHVPNQRNAEPLEKKNNFSGSDAKAAESTLLSNFKPETIAKTKKVIIDQTNLDNLVRYEDQASILMDYAILVALEKHFQLIYSYIYGSQIALLERLKTNDFETKESLKIFYDNAVEKAPVVYQSYSYGQYLAWLHNNGLLSIMENNNVIITYEGIDFLTYLDLRNFSKIKDIY